jgi:hypothetical protein
MGFSVHLLHRSYMILYSNVTLLSPVNALTGAKGQFEEDIHICCPAYWEHDILDIEPCNLTPRPATSWLAFVEYRMRIVTLGVITFECHRLIIVRCGFCSCLAVRPDGVAWSNHARKGIDDKCYATEKLLVDRTSNLCR